MSFSDNFPLPRRVEKTDSNRCVSVSNIEVYSLWLIGRHGEPRRPVEGPWLVTALMAIDRL
jgi:hypothetical protein